MYWAKYFSVISASTLKFVGGPLAGLLLNLSWYETALCTCIGMMAMVVVIIYLGDTFVAIKKRFFNTLLPAKKFSKTKRLAIRIRQQFGLLGIACCTPLFLTPIGGTALALAFKYSKGQIVLYMLCSSIFWALAQTFIVYYLKQFFL